MEGRMNKKGYIGKKKSRDIIFDFDQTNLSGETVGVGKAKRLFRRAGVRVVEIDIEQNSRRTAGVSYRKIFFSFSDSQTVEIWATRSGDIFRVKVNNSIKPIKNQADHAGAISEIAGHLDSGRDKFQAKLAKTQVSIPSAATTARVPLLKKLEEKYSSLKEAIAASEERLATI